MATSNSSNHSRLLSLPAELRLRIWEYSLAPTGTLILTTTTTKRFATNPIIAPALLRTCRQIHNEASSIIIAENSICITVDAHDTCWPTISESRLPQRVLEKLQHMCIILDCTATFRASYEDVDWTQVSALTSLKTLRLTTIARSRGQGHNHRTNGEIAKYYASNCLPHVLNRIPASTRVAYGTLTGTLERTLVENLIGIRRNSAPKEALMGRIVDIAVSEIDCGIVRAKMDEIAGMREGTVKQGSMSGGVGDVWSEYRDGFQR